MYCKHCGKEIDEAAKFCDGCGKSVAEVAAPVETEVPKKKKKKMGCFTYAIIVFLLLAACGAIVGGDDEEAEEPSSTEATAVHTSNPTIAIQPTDPLDATATGEINTLDSAVSFIEENLQGFQHYDLSYDETGITVNIWIDGLAAEASAAIDVGGSNLDSWDKMVSSLANFSGTCRKYLDSKGFSDVLFSFNVLNDQNTDNILVMIIDNSVMFDYVASSHPATTTSLGEQNALKKAHSYLRISAFSRSGLIEQLEFEGFTTDEATYAVDNCGADWNEQAIKKAASYLSLTSFSKQGLIEQLQYEGFTYEQALYGVEQNGF